MRSPSARARIPCLVMMLAASSTLIVAAPSQRGTVDRTLASAAAYVARFTATFANAVTEEIYTQELAHVGDDARSLAPTRRVIRSEFLMLRTTAIDIGWMPFRNVLEVDGRAAPNRAQRLATIFSTPSSDALARAQRITEEWTRYNIGPDRTIGSPVLALLFLQTDMQPRFRFRSERQDREFPASVSVLSYEEVARPTIIRAPEPRPGGIDYNDSPASGRFWIDSDGTVLRSELVVRSGARRVLGVGASAGSGVFTTLFQRDERRQIAVPTEMRERLATADEVLTGTARYGAFTTFAVDIDSAVVDSPSTP